MTTDDYEPWEYDDYDDEEDEMERAMLTCGLHSEEDGTEICFMAGTEHCDFSCPFRDGYYARMRSEDAS